MAEVIGGETIMKKPVRFTSSLLLAGALLAPIATFAQDRDHDRDDHNKTFASTILIARIITTGTATKTLGTASGTPRLTAGEPIARIRNCTKKISRLTGSTNTT